MNAVFLDRDGILNKQIFDTNRRIYRPPWSVSEFKLLPDVIESLRRLSYSRYELFLVTNQPDSSNGFVSLENLKQIKYHLINIMIKNKIHFKEHYYCFHSTVDKCKCKKPSPYFLCKACKDYHIDLSNCWMIGDNDKDILCGQNAGTKTILVKSNTIYDDLNPTFRAENIKDAVDIILNQNK